MSNFSDGSHGSQWDGQEDYQLTISQVQFAWIMSFVCILGILTNLAILALLKATSATKLIDSRPHYRFLKHLFLADLFMCLTNAPMFMMTAIFKAISKNSLLCSCQSVLALSFACASMLLLACLSYDRYLLVVKQTIMARKKSYKILAMVWLLSAFIGTIILIPRGGFSYGVSTSGVFCSSTWWGRQWGIIHPVFSSFILLSAMVVICFHYIHIHRYAKDAYNKIGTMTQSQFRKNKRRTAVAWNMVLLVCVFVCNWVLYLVVILYQMIWGSPFSGSLVWIDVIGTLLGFFNSTANPIVYAFLNRQKFKMDFDQLLKAKNRRLEMRATLPLPHSRQRSIGSEEKPAANQHRMERKGSIGRDKLFGPQTNDRIVSSLILDNELKSAAPLKDGKRTHAPPGSLRRRMSLPNILPARLKNSRSNSIRPRTVSSDKLNGTRPAFLPKTFLTLPSIPHAVIEIMPMDKITIESSHPISEESSGSQEFKHKMGTNSIRKQRHRVIHMTTIPGTLTPPSHARSLNLHPTNIRVTRSYEL